MECQSHEPEAGGGAAARKCDGEFSVSSVFASSFDARSFGKKNAGIVFRTTTFAEWAECTGGNGEDADTDDA